ncbi:MAG: GntR family transcriptional regulator [Mesorhizobium sp.]|uniref:GntR family transcriptional regulator n=1 Tax=Mesorhizobium sp. TaxID=1871066 RepID=UPI000FE896F8|nr:GntR family transcriptional regulator [Mesorhizobium sp.]RWI50256.1 MAG: GntR family transcriptional regulator [Mesorhizobium sp.]
MHGLIRDEIYVKLRQEILSCTLAPGTELREAALAERFDVSKSPIRDALHRLEVDRLVRVEPRRGYHVMPLSLADAEELFDLRMVMEEACVKRTSVNATDEQLSALDRFREVDVSLEPHLWIDYNREFHKVLAGFCPNKRLVERTIDVIDQFDRLIAVSISIAGMQNRPQLLAEHCDVIDALQARAGKRAAKLLGQHIGNGRKRVLSVLSRAVVVP